MSLQRDDRDGEREARIIVDFFPRVDKRSSIDVILITQSAQLLTFQNSFTSSFIIIIMLSEVYCASEKRVEEIIQVLNDGVYSSMHKCAKEMRLNHKILNNRWNEKSSKFIRESINKRLNIAQERAIKNYIMRMNKKNMSLTLKLVENVVNFMFREIDSDAASLKSCWIKRFLDRNLDLKKQRQRFISIHRKDADWIFALKQYFQQLKSVRSRIETAFSVSIQFFVVFNATSRNIIVIHRIWTWVYWSRSSRYVMTDESFMSEWNEFNEALKDSVSRLEYQGKSVKTYIN